MSDLTLAITELKDSAYRLRIYNQRLVLIFLDKALTHSSVRWFDVAANAWPILVADEFELSASHSKRRVRARRRLLDLARSKIMLALGKELNDAEVLLAEATELGDRAAKLMASGKVRGSVTALMILAGF